MGRRNLAASRLIPVKNGTLQSMAISPDGRTFSIGGEPAVIWSMTDLRELTRLEGDSGQVNCVAFSHDGKSLVTANKSCGIKCWETAGWQLKGAVAPRRHGEIESVAFAPHDGSLTAVDKNGIIHLWELASGAMDRIASGQDRLWSTAFSRDGRSLATTSRDGSVKLWEIGGSRTWTGLPPVFWSTPNGRPLGRAKYEHQI